jgi:magnesium and cobalt transporter
MGDSTDGSSTAAHSAHAQDQHFPRPKSGFFRRVIGALSPSDMGEPLPGDAPSATVSDHGQVPLDISSLRRMRVEDVAIPKADIVSVPDTITKDDLVTRFRETGFSRLPVFTGTLDTPIGMLHLKDFALRHGFNGNGNGVVEIREMLRPLLYVPPSMPIGVLLQKMQTERRHMALVIDEYGGVDGLVTIEDLIEQIIGEIEDEHDTEEADLWLREKEGQYLAQAKCPLDEFEQEIGLSLTDVDEVDEEEIDTLGGLVFMLSGRVPVRGEIVKHPAGPEFTVIDADPRRIKRLRVRVPGAAQG